MRKAADATFPAWRDLLKTALEDCALGYDTRRAVLDVHPLDDFYFAAAVGKEAALIRTLFDPEEATELLAEIAERVDETAGRKDRLVSGLVFDIISRLELSNLNPLKQPHDEIVALLLNRMGIDTTPATRRLMGDMLFRHQLGEPIALGVPSWWMAFRGKFTVTKAPALTTPMKPELPKVRRVARSLM